MAFQAVYSSGNPHGQEADATFFNGLLTVSYSRIWRRNISRVTTKLYAEGHNTVLLGLHVCELHDRGLFDGTGLLERTVFWKGIE